MKYKRIPPPRPTPVEKEQLIGGPKAPVAFPDEDNYEIQVWESEGGEFLGYALKTSLRLAVHQCWLEAIKQYPGRYLAQTNGDYEIRAVVAPTDNPEDAVPADVYLEELPQWYGLVGICTCGRELPINRYDPKILAWKGWPLSRIAEKLNCTACRAAGRPRGAITIRPKKLPR